MFPGMATTVEGNLEHQAQAFQLRLGVVFVGVGLLVAALVRTSDSSALRLAAFLPLFLGSYGIIAGIEKTCGFTALARRRITDQGPERVIDPDEAKALRRTGIRVMLTSFGFAASASILLALAR